MVTKVNYLTFAFFAVINSIVAASPGSCPISGAEEGQKTIIYNYPYGNSKLIQDPLFMALEYSSYGVYDGSDDKYTKLLVNYFYVKSNISETVAFGSLVSQASTLIQIGSAQAFPCRGDYQDLISSQYTYFDYSLQGSKVTSVSVDLEAGLYYPVKWITVEWNDDGKVYPAWDSANVRAFLPNSLGNEGIFSQSNGYSILTSSAHWLNSSSTTTLPTKTTTFSSTTGYLPNTSVPSKVSNPSKPVNLATTSEKYLTQLKTASRYVDDELTSTTNSAIIISIAVRTYSPQATQTVNGQVSFSNGCTKLKILVSLMALLTTIAFVV